MEDEIDRLFMKLSQQLDSSPAHFEDATVSEVSCSSRFATPKINKEVVKARLQAVPKKTRQDTEYCVRVWMHGGQTGMHMDLQCRHCWTWSKQHWHVGSQGSS